MIGFTRKSLFCVLLAASYALGAESDTIGSRKAGNADESTALKAEEGTGKIYFTGPGYTVNLIPHAIVLGLLGFALIFLYGDSLFGASGSTTGGEAVSTGYGAPSTGYGAPEAAYGAPAPSYSAAETDTYGTPAAPAYGAPAPSGNPASTYAVAPSPSYSAPSTGYNAANRYYDPYAANAASALGGDPYSQEPATN